MAEEMLSNGDHHHHHIINPRSGFCNSTSIFHSKRKPISISDHLDVISFISADHRRSAAVAFIDASTGRSITYAEMWRAVDAVATSLFSDMGIRKGNVVLILSPNSIFFPVACLAVMSIGAVVTTANPLSTAGELSKQIQDSEIALVFTTAELLPKLPLSLPVVLMDSDQKRGDRGTIMTLKNMMKVEPDLNRIRDRVVQDDLAAILYSSGTTGVSKGVVSTNGTLTALIGTVGPRYIMQERDQIYIANIPMFHSFGFSTFVLTLVCHGCTAVVLPQFGMDKMLVAVERFGVTYLPLVPPILVAMVNDAESINRKYNLKSLRYVLCGGAPLSEAVKEAFVGKFPAVNVLVGYALTESNGAGASIHSAEECRWQRQRPGTVGLLTPSTEAMVVDPTSGAALPVNCAGELWLRAPCNMKGYYKNKEATKCTLSSDGWLKTGDLCYIDEEGFLFVVDRLKELIKYNGYQVAPAELEGLLLTHPEIADAAVIPFPDEKVGQFPFAYVVRKKGASVTETEVINFIAKQVAPHKKVRRVAFVATIPKNPSGKILRKDLINLATSKM